jgi:hypothetical protein
MWWIVFKVAMIFRVLRAERYLFGAFHLDMEEVIEAEGFVHYNEYHVITYNTCCS